MEKTNFKNWGWWALGGVVVIAIVALAATLRAGPEPTDEVSVEGDGRGQTEVVADGSATGEEATGTEGATAGDSSALPRSGPSEASMFGLLLAGVFVYVMSLALGNVTRAAKAEK